MTFRLCFYFIHFKFKYTMFFILKYKSLKRAYTTKHLSSSAIHYLLKIRQSRKLPTSSTVYSNNFVITNFILTTQTFFFLHYQIKVVCCCCTNYTKKYSQSNKLNCLHIQINSFVISIWHPYTYTILSLRVIFHHANL